MELVQKKKFFIKTFGCKLNTYDSGFIEKEVEQAFSSPLHRLNQKEESHKDFPIYILNTCAVTHTATQEAVKLVKRLRRKTPFSFIVVTGCAAQVNTESFIELKEMGADLILANSHKNKIGLLIEKELKEKLSRSHSMKTILYKSNILKQKHLIEEAGVERFHTRSFLKIQDGCNSFCSFCIIPFARGRSRSVAAKDLIDKVNFLYDQGVREVVLTGVHIGDYCDGNTKNQFGLEKLVEALLKNTNIPRFRLSSLEPIEVSSFLLDLYKDDRLCPHFHISLQSGDVRVLKDMRRKYGPKEIEQCLMKIEKNVKGAFIGMDLIVGFPGEKEKEFKNTYFFLKNLPWTRIHVFPYSQRKGTWAYHKRDQVPRFEIKKRSQLIRHLSEKRYLESANKQLHSVKKVLCFDKKKKDSFSFASSSAPFPIDSSAQDLPLKEKGLLKKEKQQAKEKEKTNDFLDQEGISRDYWKVKINVNSQVLNFIRGKEVSVYINDVVCKDLSAPSRTYLKASLIGM